MKKLLIIAVPLILMFVGKKLKKTKDKITLDLTESLKAKFDMKSTKQSFFTKLYINISLAINNPTPVTITLQTINLGVYLNETKVGKMDKSSPTVLKSNSITKLTFKLKLPITAIAGTIKKAIKILKTTRDFKLWIRGKIDYGISEIDINEKITIFPS